MSIHSAIFNIHSSHVIALKITTMTDKSKKWIELYDLLKISVLQLYQGHILFYLFFIDFQES